MTIPRPLADRFWEKVAIGDEEDCWEWQGRLTRKGYGLFYTGKYRDDLPSTCDHAHRVALFLVGRKPPARQDVHHTCENRRCVNPWHLVVLSDRAHYNEHDFSRVILEIRRLRHHELSRPTA